jgi:hypothetical protein
MGAAKGLFEPRRGHHSPGTRPSTQIVSTGCGLAGGDQEFSEAVHEE